MMYFMSSVRGSGEDRAEGFSVHTYSSASVGTEVEEVIVEGEWRGVESYYCLMGTEFQLGMMKSSQRLKMVMVT